MVGITRRALALPLVNIGGIDIVNGQHKLLLAILWQLMRFNIRGLLQVPLTLTVWGCPAYLSSRIQLDLTCTPHSVHVAALHSLGSLAARCWEIAVCV